MTNQTPTTTESDQPTTASFSKSDDLGEEGCITLTGPNGMLFLDGPETAAIRRLLQPEPTTKRVDVGLGPAVDVTYDPDRGIVLASEALDREVVLGPAVVDAIRALLTDKAA